nr:hypothetical protein [Rhodothermales bacterium]MBO6779067.1 hypothetical protein [Rhodothermales bacterium]
MIPFQNRWPQRALAALCLALLCAGTALGQDRARQVVTVVIKERHYLTPEAQRVRILDGQAESFLTVRSHPRARTKLTAVSDAGLDLDVLSQRLDLVPGRALQLPVDVRRDKHIPMRFDSGSLPGRAHTVLLTVTD